MLLKLNKEFLKFLNSVYSRNSILKDTFYNFNDYFEYLKSSTNIPINYDKYILNFPYYPKNYKYIKELNPSGSNFKISTYKIINSIPTDNLYLQKQNFLNNIIPTNTLVEKIPTNITAINFSFLTQKIIIENNYLDSFLLNYATENVPDSYDFSYNLLTEVNQNIHESYNNINLSEIIYLFNVFYNVYIQHFKLNDDFLNFVMVVNESDQIFTNNKLIDSFLEFTNNTNSYFDSDEVFKKLSKLILKNNFNIIKPTNQLLNNFTTYYKNNEINNLNIAFTNFIDNTISDNFINRLNNTFTKVQNIIYYHIFNDFVENDLSDFIDNNYLNNSTEFDSKFKSEIIDQIVKDINEFEFKNYLLPIYQYSNSPIKFINVLIPFISDFVEKYLITNKKYELIINNTQFKNDISKLLNMIVIDEDNLTNLTDFFVNVNITAIYNNNKLGEIFSFLFIKDILIEFCDSDYFNDFIVNSLEHLNSYLYDNKIVQYNYNYFNNIQIIRSYFKTLFLKYSIFYDSDSNTAINYLYPDLKIQIDNFFNTTDFETSITYNKLSNLISTQVNYYKSNVNSYNFTKNIYQNYIIKLIYQKILTFYSIPNYSANKLNFENILDSINTTNKTLNKMVYDDTTNKYLYSSGILSESTWIDNQDNIVYIPVMPEFISYIDNFEDINHPINTVDKTLNKMVWDTNNKIYVYASGTLPESPWILKTGKIIYIPIINEFIKEFKNFININDLINVDKYLNKIVFDSSTNQLLYASGTSLDSPWVNSIGEIIYTPTLIDQNLSMANKMLVMGEYYVRI